MSESGSESSAEADANTGSEASQEPAASESGSEGASGSGVEGNNVGGSESGSDNNLDVYEKTVDEKIAKLKKKFSQEQRKKEIDAKYDAAVAEVKAAKQLEATLEKKNKVPAVDNKKDPISEKGGKDKVQEDEAMNAAEAKLNEEELTEKEKQAKLDLKAANDEKKILEEERSLMKEAEKEKADEIAEEKAGEKANQKSKDKIEKAKAEAKRAKAKKKAAATAEADNKMRDEEAREEQTKVDGEERKEIADDSKKAAAELKKRLLPRRK